MFKVASGDIYDGKLAIASLLIAHIDLLTSDWTEGALLYVQAGRPSASAKPNVVVMGQDEFHDALESAAESASIASTPGRQYDSGQNPLCAGYINVSCSCPWQHLPAYGIVFLLILSMFWSPVYSPQFANRVQHSG